MSFLKNFNWHEALVMAGLQLNILSGAQTIYGIFLKHNGTMTNVRKSDFFEKSDSDKFFSAVMEFKDIPGNAFLSEWLIQFQYIGMFIGSILGGHQNPALFNPYILVVMRLLTGPNARLILTLICFLAGNWRIALFIFGTFSIITAAFYTFAVPESPNWLQKKGRTDDAKNIRSLVLKRSNYKCDIVLGDTAQIPFRAIFKMPRLRNTFLLLSFMWICNSFTAVVTDFGFTEIVGTNSFFLSQVLISAILFCAKATLGIFEILTGYVSRRNLHLISLFGSTVFYAIAGIALAFKWDLVNNYLFAVPYIIGLIFTEFCWDACYLCVIELMPTEMRATAAGACSLVARIGAMLATLTLYLQKLYAPSALFVVSFLAFVNFVIIYFALQETKSVHLGKVGSRKVSSRRPSRVDVFPEPDKPRRRSIAEEEYEEIQEKQTKSANSHKSSLAAPPTIVP
ncbi:hypothetical protein WR25_18938 [Diploscapter pachys]|uniref:Major facilitator superfamily (MFS) profile domain-containing protein n=1 Tax=Diploscapter pachys TaxID=2018661 RepID=A0A2A2K942_9BILA|nr:hypothetical protein WR25_18938 [Diploscapter pachys]